MTDSAKRDATEAGAYQAEAAPDEAAQAEAEPAAGARDGDGAKPDIDEVKRKFREALDRKREIHAEGQGKGGHDQGKIHGAQGPAGGRRSFRRKSG